MDKLIYFLRKYREIVLYALDTLAFILSLALAYYIRMDLENIHSVEVFYNVFHSVPWLMVCNVIVLIFTKVNRTLWQYTSIDEVVRVCFAVLIVNIVLVIYIAFFPHGSYPRTIPVILSLLQVFFMLGMRITYRFYRRLQMQSNRHHRAVIIGAGSAGSIVQRDLMLNNQYDAKVVGFIDDAIEKKGKIISGKEVLGTTKDLQRLASKYDLDIAYIAIKNISKNNMRDIIDRCRLAGLKTQIINLEFINGDQAITKIRDVSIDDLLGRGEIKLDNAGIGEYLTDKKVMVTGAGGSIGSELVRQIIEFHPQEIILVDIYENNMYDLQQELWMKQKHAQISSNFKITCLLASVRDKKRLNFIIHKYCPSVIFHAAAHKHVPLVEDSPMEAIKNNVFGTLNVVQCAIENRVDKFVLISTDKAVNPTNVMGATKRMCELIVQGYRNNGYTKLCAVRFGNVLGSNGSVIPLFKRQIEEGGPVTVTHPDIIRYFMTIPEAVRLVLQAGMYAKDGEIFVLDMGTPVKILDLAENLIRLSGFQPYDDIKIEFSGLRPGEKMFEELLYDKDTHIKTENDLIYISKPSLVTQDDIQRKLEELDDILQNGGDYKQVIMNAIQ